MTNMPADKNSEWWGNFQSLLESELEWPSEYQFKFVVPQAQLKELEAVFRDVPMQVRESSKGKYASVTIKMMMRSSDEVIDVYTSVKEIEGIILL